MERAELAIRRGLAALLAKTLCLIGHAALGLAVALTGSQNIAIDFAIVRGAVSALALFLSEGLRGSCRSLV